MHSGWSKPWTGFQPIGDFSDLFTNWLGMGEGRERKRISNMDLCF